MLRKEKFTPHTFKLSIGNNRFGIVYEIVRNIYRTKYVNDLPLKNFSNICRKRFYMECSVECIEFRKNFYLELFHLLQLNVYITHISIYLIFGLIHQLDHQNCDHSAQVCHFIFTEALFIVQFQIH